MSDKIIEIGNRVPVEQRSKKRERRFCVHESGIWLEQGTMGSRNRVICKACDEELDPFQALLIISRTWDRYRRTIERAKEATKVIEREKLLKQCRPPLRRIMNRELLKGLTPAKGRPGQWIGGQVRLTLACGHETVRWPKDAAKLKKSVRCEDCAYERKQQLEARKEIG